jgi:hypothetical protein
MTLAKRTNIRLGAAFAMCTLITAASAVSANSPSNDQVTAAVPISTPPSAILAIVSPEHVGEPGKILFGERDAEGLGQHFGGPR